MAITIQSQPSGVVSAYNPIDYLVSSNNTGETSFKYFAQVYVDGVIVHTVAFPPEPETGNSRGFMNVAEIVESYLTKDFNTAVDDTQIERNPNSICDLYVSFGEQYDVSGTITTYSGLTNSNTIQAINSAFTHFDWIAWDYTEYYNNSASETKFLTNQPRGRTVKDSANHWLYWMGDESSIYNSGVVVVTYDSDGVQNGSFTFGNPYYQGGTTDDDHLRVPSGINLNSVTGVTALTGATPILDSDVYSYSIAVVDNVVKDSSEAFLFNRDFDCTGFEEYTLHFMNEYGGFDHFTFDLVKRDKYTKETKQYKAQGYELSSSAVTRSISNHERRSYHTETKQSFKLTSNWITKAEHDWLRELFDSPIVYMEDDSGNMWAVSHLSLNDWEEKLTYTDKTFNLELEVFISFDNYRQRW